MYDKNLVKNLLAEVKKTNITVDKKSLHKSKLYEIKNLYNKCMELNRWLFDPDNEYNYRNYKQSIELKESNKELNKNLRLCLLYLHNQLAKIYDITA